MSFRKRGLRGRQTMLFEQALGQRFGNACHAFEYRFYHEAQTLRGQAAGFGVDRDHARGVRRFPAARAEELKRGA
ncbi:MAG: hypothetical protein UY76_C0033G0001, partial [Candidatus Uhrbacteria bacterium GW2011_GWA2_52_8d]